MRKINFSFVVFAIIAFFTLNLSAHAQVAAGSKSARPLITGQVDSANLVTLKGNTRPEARAEYDRGAVADDFPMEHMWLQLKRAPEQQQALDTLVEQLHHPGNPLYHKWLTPAEFGETFGLATSDIATITSWLESQGFKVNYVYPNGTLIDFSGTAGTVRNAFHTEIHNLVTRDGKKHIANMSDPKIPAALVPAVAGVMALHNFFPQPMVHNIRAMERKNGSTKATIAKAPAGSAPNDPLYQPLFTATCPASICGEAETFWLVGSADFNLIYNVTPQWNASTPITGTGQTIAVVEDSNMANTADFKTFRTAFIPSAVATGTLTQEHPNSGGNCTNPGNGDAETEAALDTEWAGTAAPGANVILASCADTTTTFGGLIATQNLLNSGNTPQILSMSYGECEAANGTAENAVFNATYEQAAAQGQSMFVSSGDSMVALCDGNGAPYSTAGISVNGWGSTPYNVSVGGTDFGDTYAGTNSTYWNTTNGTNYLSAKSYVPEVPWNDSCTSILVYKYLGYASGEAFCNTAEGEDDFLTTGGGSGGPSEVYAKPSYQAGFAGIVNDGVRDMPDVALFASNGIWNHFLEYCDSSVATCNYNNATDVFDLGAGGTSFASPSMAGIQALINQKTGQAQGDPNYILYALASAAYGTGGSSTCNATLGNAIGSSCVFHDLTQGDIGTPCETGTVNCYTKTGSDAYGEVSTSTTSLVVAYPTTTGWDFASGIGSPNVSNLVNAWAAYSSGTPTMTVTASPSSQNAGKVEVWSVTVTGNNSYPTGSIAFTLTGHTGTVATVALGGYPQGSPTACTTTCTSTVTYNYTIPAGTAVGAYTVTATYNPTNEQYATTSGSAIYNVVTGTSSTTLSANPTTSTIGGTPIVFTSVTTYGNDGTTTPTGTVKLTAPGAGTLATLAVSGSSCTINATAKTITCSYSWVPNYGGTLVVTATYSGDSNYASSSGSTTVTVTKLATTITAAANPTTVTEAAPGTILTATVSYAAAGVTEPSPTGTVSWDLSGGVGAVATMNVSACTTNTTARTISCTYNFSTAWNVVENGTYTLTGVYSGDGIYASSTSAGSTFTVAGTDTSTTTITLGTTSSVYATGGTTAATVVVTGTAGDGHTTGTVTITGSGGLGTLGTIVLNTTNCTATNGRTYTCTKTLTIPAGTPVAAYTITASYPGDVNYEPSSGTATYTVTQATPTAAIAAASGTYGSTITLSATNTGVTNGVAPTGAATFKVNGVTAPGTASCSGSGVVETCTLSYQIDLAPGSYSTGVSFAADTNYKAATATGTLTSSKQTPTAAMVSPVSTSPVTQTQGALSAFAVSGTLSWTGSGTAPTKADISATSTAPGTFSALSCTAGTLVYNCSGTFTPTSTDTAGNYNINISFSGDANYSAAASTQAGNYVINAATTPTVTLSPVSAPYGSTAGQSITVTATGDNGAIATFGTTGGVGGSFSPTTCTIASNTCSTSYIPSGTLAVGTYTNDLTVTVAAHGSYGPGSGASTLTITTTKGDIGFSSVTHNMGSVAIGNSTRYTVAVYNNTGAAIPFTAVQLVTTASPNPFATQNNCGTSIPTTGCEIAFTYTPVAGDSGTETATWSLTGVAPGTTFNPSNGGTLTGTVATSSGVTLTTAGHNFGDVTVGTTSPTYGTVLTNSTNAAVTLTLGSVSSPFGSVTNCPATLGAGVSCNLQFTFSPTTTGIIQQVYSLAANGGAVPITVGGTPVTGITLTGTGD